MLCYRCVLSPMPNLYNTLLTCYETGLVGGGVGESQFTLQSCHFIPRPGASVCVTVSSKECVSSDFQCSATSVPVFGWALFWNSSSECYGKVVLGVSRDGVLAQYRGIIMTIGIFPEIWIWTLLYYYFEVAFCGWTLCWNGILWRDLLGYPWVVY